MSLNPLPISFQAESSSVGGKGSVWAGRATILCSQEVFPLTFQFPVGLPLPMLAWKFILP